MRLYEISKINEWRILPPPKSKWTPMKILRNILGRNKVTDTSDDSKIKPGMYAVSKTWMSNMPLGAFLDMDNPPGGGGSIALPDVYGSTVEALVPAIHEGYHAYLHMTGADFMDEQAVNNLSTAWIMNNMSGIEQKKSLEYLQISKDSYGH